MPKEVPEKSDHLTHGFSHFLTLEARRPKAFEVGLSPGFPIYDCKLAPQRK